MRRRVKKNEDVRQRMNSSGVFQWQLAEKYGYSEFHFSRLLRKELPETEKEELMKMIDEISSETEDENPKKGA